MASGAAARQPDTEEDPLANTMATMSPVASTNSLKAAMASGAAASQPDMEEDPLAATQATVSPMPSYDALAATTDPLAATTASAKAEAPFGRVGTVYMAGPPPDEEDSMAATIAPGPAVAAASSVKADDELAQSVGSVAAPAPGPPTAASPPTALQPPTASMQSSTSATPFGSMANSMALPGSPRVQAAFGNLATAGVAPGSLPPQGPPTAPGSLPPQGPPTAPGSLPPQGPPTAPGTLPPQGPPTAPGTLPPQGPPTASGGLPPQGPPTASGSLPSQQGPPGDSPFGSVANSMAMPAPPGGASLASMPFGSVGGSLAPLPPAPAAGPKTMLPGQHPAPLGGPRTMLPEQQPLAPLGGPRTMMAGQQPEQPPEPLGGPRTMLPGQQPGPFSVGNGVMPSMPPAPELVQQSSEHQTMAPSPLLQPGVLTSVGQLSTVDEGCEESQAGTSMPPGSLMTAGLNSFDAAFQATPEAAFYPENQLFDVQMDVKYPHIKELDHHDVWYTVGDPEMRIDPHWRHDQWWLAAPVDFVGLEKHGYAKSERLAMVDLVVSETSKAGRMPPLPAPARTRNADDCPIC